MGFILAADLPGAGCTGTTMLATEALVPAIELIDTRIRIGRSRSATPSAGNASAAELRVGRGPGAASH